MPTSHLAREIASQPDTWAAAVELAGGTPRLPARGARVAVIGCGTSWFMAQSYARLRETSGQGATDAFTATEAALDRDYDAVIAITRSGTTTEVLELLDEVRGRIPTIGIVGDTGSPLVDLVDTVIGLPFADERSVVQTRFATSALTYLRASTGQDLTSAIDEARGLLDWEPDDGLLEAEQFSFLGTGWTIGLAHEAALKMREAAQLWTESYPAMEYRHGPISIAAPGRVTWILGAVPERLQHDIEATGARFEHGDRDPLADLIRTQKLALARALALGLDPDQPRNLTRSVVLDDHEA